MVELVKGIQPGRGLERSLYSKSALYQKAVDAAADAADARSAAHLAEERAKLAAEVAKTIAGSRDVADGAVQAALRTAETQRAACERALERGAHLAHELRRACWVRNSLAFMALLEALAVAALLALR